MADPADALGIGRTPPHEYGGLGPRRWRAPWSRWATVATTALGAAVVGFLVVAGLWAGREAAVAQDETKEELIALIAERQEHAEALSEELDQLRAEVDEAESSLVAGLPALSDDLAEAEAAAGLAAVRGPGLEVTLTDGGEPCPSQPADCRIQDVDLQLAVNTLFDVGAEAVAVDGERVTATTSVRGAGQLILVNHRVLTSPYEIVAVGEAQAMRDGFAASTLARDFSAWEDDYGLGLSVDAVDEVVVPAHSGALGVQVAEPGAEGGEGAAP